MAIHLVDPAQIEAIVGIERHATRHALRLVSLHEAWYVLHSRECLDRGDLVGCPYSLAADNTDFSEWPTDEPLYVVADADPEGIWLERWDYAK